MKQIAVSLTFLTLVFCNSIFAQNNKQTITSCSKILTQQALQKISAEPGVNNMNTAITEKNSTGLYQCLSRFNPLKKPKFHPGGTKLTDTLYVGPLPTDSLIITGNYFQNGPIVVYGDGKLRICHANLTVLGDIWVWGATAEITIDSSQIYCPQQYFYQRAITTVGGGKVIIRNSSMDYSGLSHSLGTTDSSLVEMDNVTFSGFTTSALFGKSEIHINGSNQAGEFVIDEHTKVDVQNAATVLLWHVFPAGSLVNFDFPDSGYVATYSFNNSTPGVSGVGYDIHIANCTGVMWGMMPSTNSDVTITNSNIRAIGVWFTGGDSMQVNGLVNNSTYNTFVANLSDRHLELQNCSVQTWSLYTYDSVNIDITGCILGEIGAMGKSKVNCQNVFVDGSGGYTWGTDRTFFSCGWSTMASEVRSSGNGIFIFGYSSQMNNASSATGSSVMIVVQSSLPQDPVAYDAGCAWFANVDQLASACVDQNIPVTGSAWICKTPISTLMDFAWYRMFFKKESDTGWTAITGKVYSEVHHNVLATWNTQGLVAGPYVLRLLLCDNTIDSNQVEAIKEVNLLPSIFGINETDQSYIHIYPNPVQQKLFIELPEISETSFQIKIYDITGKLLISKISEKPANSLNTDWMKSGIYFLEINTGSKVYREKFVKE